MPQLRYCHGCAQTFTSYQYFQQHLQANDWCARYFVARPSARADGTCRPTYENRAWRQLKRYGWNRDDFIGSAAHFLESEDQRRIEQMNAATLEEFEFMDDDNPTPQKRIRVAELNRAQTGSKEGNITLGDVHVAAADGTGLVFEKEVYVHQDKGNIRNGDALTGACPGTVETNAANEDVGANMEENEGAAGPTGENADAPPGVTVHETAGTGVTAGAGDETAERTGPKRSEWILNQFKEYVGRAKSDFSSFSADMKAAVELMQLMNSCGGSTTLYDAVFEWHLQHLKVDKTVSADVLHKRLVDRYNLGPTLPYERTVNLPHSKELVKVPCHDWSAQVRDLLTDPRWTDEDWSFHNDNPYSDPPENWTTVGDLNTSLAFRKTWEKLIKPAPFTPCGRKKVLAVFVGYYDGTQTNKFGNASLEIVKFTLGNLNSKARTKDYAWRYIGFVRKVLKRNKAAEDNITESGHIDGNDFIKDPKHRQEQFEQKERTGPLFNDSLYKKPPPRRRRKTNVTATSTVPELKAQDLHAFFQCILDSYKEVEDDGGFPWDHRYRGKTYHLWYIPYIHIWMGDSVEQEKICGTYGCNLEGVKNICRMCCLPADQTDQVYFAQEPARKTQDMILNLVKQNTDTSRQQLKNLSQHEIWNCFYRHRFGMHNNSGIHGATPMEVLHWVQLNTYKYNREAFFCQTGEKSKLSNKIDALTQTFGILLERQSDRNMPRTRFAEGIRGGFMQAHEMTGAMLLLGLTITSTAGRNLLKNEGWGKAKVFFETDTQIENWIRLLELHLTFEKWLGKEEHTLDHLEKAKTKVREMMSMTKHVGQRSKGRQYKVGSFHTTLHMPTMAIELGAPRNFSTESPESHHKKDKKTANRTNKQFDTFDISVATKCVYRHGVDLAMEEIHNGLVRWNYYRRAEFEPVEDPQPFESELTGPSILYRYAQDRGNYVSKIVSKMTGKDSYKYDPNTSAFIASLAQDFAVENDPPIFKSFGTLRMFSPTAANNTQLFHAMPYSRGKPWNDWAMFDLSDPDSEFPQARAFVAAQIKCFLDFRHLPQNNATMKPPGIYAIIEPTRTNDNAEDLMWSELWHPIIKDACTVPGFDQYNKQEMVSIDQILQPAVVVPDLENANSRAYLRMLPIDLWASNFDFWLDQPHMREFE